MEGADRLHALDLAWLEMEGDGPPIAIGTVAVVDGPAPGDEAVRALLDQRLPRMARLHQRLVDEGPVRRPDWVQADALDLDRHLYRVPAPAGGAHPLDVAVGAIMESPMPRDRPLWDAWVVTDLPDGRWALVWRVHHTVVDGLGALSLLGHGFDLAPDGGPTLAEAILEGHSRAARADPTTSSDDPPSAGPAPSGVGRLLDGLRESLPHVAPALGSLVPHRPSALTGAVGEHRTWATVEVPLAEAKVARRAFGTTVNDVVLAGVAGGFRDLLAHRGQPVAGRTVRNLVPVSLRPAGDGRAGNHISALLGHLPVGLADPVDRLRAIAARVEHGKQSNEAAVGALLLSLVDRAVPAAVQDVAVATAGRALPAWFFDTLTTNVPGPQYPVHLMGRRVRAMFPIIPVAGHTAITTGIFSYDGTLDVAVTGDADVAGDVRVLAEGIRRAIGELAERAAAGHA
jgi:diacylglycerol O-acyltransferase